MKKAKLPALILLLMLMALMLTGCLPGIEVYTSDQPAGFLDGVWHGWCAPVSLLLQAFGMETHMFAEPNTGLSYELGFYMAVISGFGGLSLIRRKRKRG